MKSPSKILPAAGALLLAVSILSLSPPAAAQVTERVSLGAGGVQGDNVAHSPALSGNGRFVAFQGEATNLVPGDTNSMSDCFVHDRTTGTLVRVSLSSAGAEGNAASSDPALSSSGRYVAFSTYASNLDPEDSILEDVYLRDRDPDANGVYDEGNGTTTWVSHAGPGVQPDGLSATPSISGDGRLLAFASAASNLMTPDLNGAYDIYLRDLDTDALELISQSSASVRGTQDSLSPAISPDGRHVAFTSGSPGLVPGDSNGWDDVFVRDRLLGTTVRVSVHSSGAEGDFWSYRPTLSSDGRYVAFVSYATTLVDGDTNGVADVFVHDRDPDANGLLDEGNGVTSRVSVSSSGEQSSGESSPPSLSGDGRYVTFSSTGHLVVEDNNSAEDLFLHDRLTGVTTRLSVNSIGEAGNHNSLDLAGPAISSDGSRVAFTSMASNLVAADSNGFTDVFVRDQSTWSDLGWNLRGLFVGAPVLSGAGTLAGGDAVTFTFLGTRGFAPIYFLIGFSKLDTAFKGGVMVPKPDLLIAGLVADANGDLTLSGIWPTGVGAGFTFYFQNWVVDSGGPLGFASSNGLAGTTP